MPDGQYHAHCVGHELAIWANTVETVVMAVPRGLGDTFDYRVFADENSFMKFQNMASFFETLLAFAF
jgi:hypothetical protein